MTSLAQFSEVDDRKPLSPKAAIKVLIGIPAVIERLDPLFTNGLKSGHKVGDGIDAARELRAFDKEHQHILAPFESMSDFEVSQHLRGALRSRLEIDPKTWKLTGKVAKRIGQTPPATPV